MTTTQQRPQPLAAELRDTVSATFLPFPGTCRSDRPTAEVELTTNRWDGSVSATDHSLVDRGLNPNFERIPLH